MKVSEMSGLIHLYHGDGKGKTTASLGLTIRALGNGFRVLFVQFLKNQETGELVILNDLPGVTLIRGKEGSGFSFSMTEEEKGKTRQLHTENLKTAIELARSGEYDMLVLDEIIGACRRDLVDQALLEDFVRNKPNHLELVMTGREPAAWMIDCADYISEIKKEKHPYDRGIPARKGIEK